jgi:hypothetical protein
MNLDELREYVWERAPLGRAIIGRSTVNDLVQLTVENWEPQMLRAAAADGQTEIVCKSMEASVKRMHQLMSGKEPREYGIFWSFILQLMVSAIIQIVLRWWQERPANRVFLLTMQAELTK